MRFSMGVSIVIVIHHPRHICVALPCWNRPDAVALLEHG
jgi:hypothetical protein